ncbi:hypothetical protein GC169_05550 [bacterium]|nr:hypothetical protein [bacterium]
MIDKAIASLLKVISAEASANPAFARKMEEALDTFAHDYVERRRDERVLSGFNPFVEFKKSPQDFDQRLSRFDRNQLALIIEKHGIDPARSVNSRTSKKKLAEMVAAAAEKRAARDAKVFDY